MDPSSAPSPLAQLPAWNAALNATATGLLVLGRALVRRGRIAAHRRVMIAATATSSLFLALYIAHKVYRGFQHTSFGGEGVAQLLYLSLLITHIALASVVPPLALTLIVLGLRDRRDTHRRVARVAWPIWIYVSVTGVLIYFLLYHLNPSPATGPRSGERPLAFPLHPAERVDGGAPGLAAAAAARLTAGPGMGYPPVRAAPGAGAFADRPAPQGGALGADPRRHRRAGGPAGGWHPTRDP